MMEVLTVVIMYRKLWQCSYTITKRTFNLTQWIYSTNQCP